MTAPTIPGSTTQAVSTAAGTYNFVPAWWNFFNSLLAYVSTGPIGPVPLAGVTDGSNAAAGNVGEYIANVVPFASGVSLTSGTPAQLATITLSAGDWDVTGEVFFAAPATRVIDFYVGFISNVNTGTFPGTSVPGDGFDYGQVQTDDSHATGGTSAEPYTINGLTTRVNITSPLTLYLMGEATFTGSGTVTGYGALRARRRR